MQFHAPGLGQYNIYVRPAGGKPDRITGGTLSFPNADGAGVAVALVLVPHVNSTGHSRSSLA